MNFLTYLTHTVSLIIEYIGLIIVAAGAFTALYNIFSKKIKEIRPAFAGKILLGLEFVIAAEIIEVAIIAEIQDFMKLGATVLIRVVLGWALKKEIEK